MPTAPSLDGLPWWLQLLVTLIFGGATLGVAFKGYKKTPVAAPSSTDAATAVIAGATIADMGAIRRLSDTVAQLDGHVLTLTTAINENTHWVRNNADQMRDVCQEVHVLVLEMQRQGRDSRGWDKRDEQRRDDDRRSRD